MTPKAIAVAIVSAAVLALGVSPHEARAGTYDVWTCRAPNGAAAPTADAAGGWAVTDIKTGTGTNFGVDKCGTGGSLDAVVGAAGTQPGPASVVWSFEAPPATNVRQYTLDYEAYSRPMSEGATAWGDVAVHTSRQVDPVYEQRFYAAGLVGRHTFAGNAGGASYVRTYAGCVPRSPGASCEPSSSGSVASFSIYRGTFTLEDRDAPTVTSVSGDAVTQDAWGGRVGISVGASDAGGGVYRMLVDVDGQVRSAVNLAGAPCVTYPGSAHTFLSPKPCPTDVGGVQLIDTNQLPEGVHTVRVLVEDAAGNQTTALGPVTRRIRHQDPGPNNGTPSVDRARIVAHWAGKKSRTRKVSYGVRPTIKGTLVATDKRPVAHAQVRAVPTLDTRGATAAAYRTVTTDSKGRFRMKVARGASSRTLRLEYHQRLYDDKPVATRTLKLRVRAGLTLKLSRHTARRGQRVRLSGTLRGRPLPAKSKVLELQARNPHKRWITFRTIRTRSKGRFSAHYRFRNRGPARFQMRVRARRSGDYPYTTGSSHARTIRIRG